MILHAAARRVNRGAISQLVDKPAAIRYDKHESEDCMRPIRIILSLIVLWTAGCATAPAGPASPAVATPISEFDLARQQMVSEQIERRGVRDETVLAAMRSVPRHEFVLERFLDDAYADSPLPIDHGQTISQPYIVAWMSALLQVEPGDRVLEIGTGSGYQAAVLAEMGVEVYTVEIIPELATEAAARLERLGYSGIHTLTADGYFGWEEFAPYDAIIVTAAPDHLPQPLASQLAEGGRLVIPIGPVGAVQTLWIFEKIEGEIQATSVGAVRFVPLTGER
jgi:protein-L-isoaspartate(D-aspartate) O-methyltransferase